MKKNGAISSPWTLAMNFWEGLGCLIEESFILVFQTLIYSPKMATRSHSSPTPSQNQRNVILHSPLLMLICLVFQKKLPAGLSKGHECTVQMENCTTLFQPLTNQV